LEVSPGIRALGAIDMPPAVFDHGPGCPASAHASGFPSGGAGGELPLSDAQALAFADADAVEIESLMRAASAVRDRGYANRLTFSPKVFLPLTNLCRNRCDYCSFRKSPGDPGAWTMSHAQVCDTLAAGQAQRCVEALFCLGDKPEQAFSAYRDTLRVLGHVSTVDYLEWAARQAVVNGLLAHTNAGVLTRAELAQLRACNVSLGLMLENVSPRLCGKGMPHHRAPDKRPAVRLRTLEEAGQLSIPFTTGILIGIGETRRERVESLLAIRVLHERYGHIQEVIVQNFVPKPEIAMADVAEQADAEMLHAVAMARLIMPVEVSVQAPPNLNAARTSQLIAAGINDFGGISPVTPDYINPGQPWPHLLTLRQACEGLGFDLQPRLPLYDRYLDPRWVDPQLLAQARAAREGLVSWWADRAPPGDVVPSSKRRLQRVPAQHAKVGL
jgi:FO synthase